MKKFLSFILLFSVGKLLAQVGPYTWQDHLSLNTANSVCRYNNKIYASNYNGIVILDEEEGSTKRLNKINGLNDVGIRLLRVNESTKKLLVIYDNSNIDIVDEKGGIKNYPDIKLKSISGKKAVNEVFFQGKMAYLATGLGIILFDTEKLEIKDTYVIGPNGTNLEVFQVTMNDSLIFAATPVGLLYANYKTQILNNYSNWKKAPGIPAGIYSGVVKVSDKILASYSPSRASLNQALIDTLYILKNNIWSRYLDPVPNLINKLSYVYGDFFAMFGQFGPLVMNVNTKETKAYITSFNGATHDPQDIFYYYDKGDALSFWVADKKFGLFQTYGYHPFFVQTLKSINGTNKSLVSNIDVLDGEVLVSPSYPYEDGSTIYQVEGINHFRNNLWEYFVSTDLNNNLVYDYNAVLLDRKDKSRIWASAWGTGLFEFKDHKLVAVYDANNSPLGQVIPGSVRASGLSMDKDGNLWIACSDAKEYICVRKRDGTFVSFNFMTPRFTRRIMADSRGYIWALHEREQGLTVFKPTNFGPAIENVNYRVLSKEYGKGNLESNAVHSIAEDKDGKIWIGTSEGIKVIYSPEKIFTTNSYDAEPIKIVQDGNVELLLHKEIITAILVDGANNKWVGTQTSGLYCFSPDGQKELKHFTKDNSPLYSNNIIDLNYDKVTGDIFIGTDLGLQSFRSVIIEGEESYSSIFAYPNPVRPNYSGSVFVRGLIDNTVVKITDSSGNIVWETKSQGGQIEWPVKNFSGSRVATGVYIVYAAIPTGELKAMTKVLVVN